MTAVQPDPTPAGSGRIGPLRARMHTQPPHTGWFDGAWWPYGENLTAELPSLLAVVAPLVEEVHRVIYHPGDWAGAPPGFRSGGTWVRLNGFRRKSSHTLDVIGVAGARIGLLVVPPHTDSATAHAILATAATPGDVSRIQDLLAPPDNPAPRGRAFDSDRDTQP